MEKVLIVEDEKLIRQGIKAIVSRSEVPIQTILECNNGLTALEVLRSEKIDVMFTDIHMPKMDGIELVKQVQTLEHKPLIVVISGYDDFSYAVQLLREGVREYILKPVDREQIKAVLEKLNKEIDVDKERQNDEKRIGWQQLKNYMLNQYITPEEKALITKRYKAIYPSQVYCVACGLKESVPKEDFKNTIILEDVEGHTLYIIGSEEDEAYIKEEASFVGFSKNYEDIDALTSAYQEAKYARQQAFYGNKEWVIFDTYQETQKAVITGAHTFDEKQMLQIVQMVGTHKIGEALRVLKLMEVAVTEKALSFDTFEENIRILIKEMIKIYQNVLEIESVDQARLTSILGHPCAEVYMEILIQWMIEINESITNKFDDYKNRQKIKEAISYIKQHYDTDLNMAVVSNHISMNYSLFSHVFKQYTGKNFVSYLKDLRMEEAKRLLSDTTFKVNEISHKIGYDNEKHFMKIFKTVCGVSPTEYRKNMLFKETK